MKKAILTGLLLAAIAFASYSLGPASAQATYQEPATGNGGTHPFYTTEEIEEIHGQGNTKRVVVAIEEYDGDVWFYEAQGNYYKALN